MIAAAQDFPATGSFPYLSGYKTDSPIHTVTANELKLFSCHLGFLDNCFLSESPRIAVQNFHLELTVFPLLNRSVLTILNSLSGTIVTGRRCYFTLAQDQLGRLSAVNSIPVTKRILMTPRHPLPIMIFEERPAQRKTM
jgi:hypothetical protein